MRVFVGEGTRVFMQYLAASLLSLSVHVLIIRAVCRPTSLCESIPTELISLLHLLPYRGVLCLPFACIDIVVMNRCRVWPDHI